MQFRGFAEADLVCDVRRVGRELGETARVRLDEVVARHGRHQLEDLIAPVAHVLVPMFFVYTGLQVDLASLGQRDLLLAALAVTIVAFAGKLVSGLVAGRTVRRWLVGWGMAPRGEVGLIFAATGKALGVIPDEVFSMLILVVLLTTLLTPPVLVAVIRRGGVTQVDGRRDAPAGTPGVAPRPAATPQR